MNINPRHETIRLSRSVPGPPNQSGSPQFRAAFRKQQQRKKLADDFLSLNTVHSRSRTHTDTDGCCSASNPYIYESYSFGSLDSDVTDDSFDGDSSFASLEGDDEDADDAYREFRNQMARVELESTAAKKAAPDAKGLPRGTAKFRGVHGTPLDSITE